MLRFPLVVGVVFIHAYETDVVFASGSVGLLQPGWLLDLCRNLISQGIARVAVPLFFLMAGYFFFLQFEWTAACYKKKLRDRLHTLLIPFLFWNVCVLALFAVAQSMPATQHYFSGNKAAISTFGAFDYLNAIFGITRFPVSFQFWFIRDLMIMVLLAPLVYVILRRMPVSFLVLVFVCWFFQLWPIYVPSSVALAFFSAGAYVACSGRSLFAWDRYGRIIGALYLVILFADALTKNWIFNGYLHRCGILVGIVVALYITRYIMSHTRLKNFLLWGAGCSFFVFAVHEPVLTMFRGVVYKMLAPASDWLVLLLYVGLPVLVIALAMSAYCVMKWLTPRFLGVISGGR